MLICSCNVITSREIEQIIVPAKVYRELDKRCKCSGCVPNVVDLITRVTHEYHLEIADRPAEVSAPPAEAPQRRKQRGTRHERRSAGHRAA